jgi:hypothetical protein
MTKSRLLQHARSSHRPLRLNRKHNFAALHALQIYRSNAIYSFIPKNACSTMRLSLAIANGCIPDAADINWIHNNNETFTADLAALARADYTFVILRDPFARLASCFLDKFVAKDQPAWHLHDLIDRTLHPDNITFADWIDALAVKSTRNADIHWRPQSDFLVCDRYDDYFAVEDFASAAATIKQNAALDIIDARPFTKHGLDRFRLLPADLDHSRTPVFELAQLQRNGDSPHPRSLFTQPLIESVSTLYAPDIALYSQKLGLPTLASSPTSDRR